MQRTHYTIILHHKMPFTYTAQIKILQVIVRHGLLYGEHSFSSLQVLYLILIILQVAINPIFRLQNPLLWMPHNSMEPKCESLMDFHLILLTTNSRVSSNLEYIILWIRYIEKLDVKVINKSNGKITQ